MGIKLSYLAGALFAAVGGVAAGPVELESKETAPPPTITQSEPWQFTLAAPGWLASLDGTIGVRGVNADIDVPIDEVLQHLDMIFAMRAEAQKGHFGLYSALCYVEPPDTYHRNVTFIRIHDQLMDNLVTTDAIAKPV